MQNTELPLFPLQILLLPGERSQLHIFEQRYRQLLEDCERGNTPFGIPFALNGKLTGFGSVVSIAEILDRHENGTTDIEVEAQGLFRLDRFDMRMGEKLYPGGIVMILDSIDQSKISKSLFAEVQEYLKKWDPTLLPELFRTDLNRYDVGRLLNISEPEKLKLIQSKSIKNQETILKNYVRLLDKAHQQAMSIDGKIFLN